MEEGKQRKVRKASETKIASTMCEATGYLATVFRSNLQPSPLHVEGSAQLLPATHPLFKAFESAVPARKRQWAITPKLLRGLYTLAGLAFPGTHNTPGAIAADLALVGLFFTMRSYKNTTTPQQGQSNTAGMLGVTFLEQ